MRTALLQARAESVGPPNFVLNFSDDTHYGARFCLRWAGGQLQVGQLGSWPDTAFEEMSVPVWSLPTSRFLRPFDVTLLKPLRDIYGWPTLRAKARGIGRLDCNILRIGV